MPIRLPPPSGPKITLRFVLHNGIAADTIAWRERTVMPFAPCHAECITPDGRHLGQFGEAHDGQPAGMQVRADGYDIGGLQKLPDGRLCDLIVDLPVTQAQADAFYAAAETSIGQPYDWNSLFGFAPIPIHLAHQVGHTFCSAKMFLLLRTKGCEWFRWPVVMPAHEIDPAMLLLMISGMVEVPH